MQSWSFIQHRLNVLNKMESVHQRDVINVRFSLSLFLSELLLLEIIELLVHLSFYYLRYISTKERIKFFKWKFKWEDKSLSRMLALLNVVTGFVGFSWIKTLDGIRLCGRWKIFFSFLFISFFLFFFFLEFFNRKKMASAFCIPF